MAPRSLKTTGSPVTIAVYRGREGLARIEGDWDRLVRGLEHPRFFHLYRWYWSYLDALEPEDSTVHFFVAYRNDEPLAVFPLKSVVRTRRGLTLRCLETPRHSHVPRWDCIGAPNGRNRGALRALLRYLTGRGRDRHLAWDYVAMEEILEDSCAAAWLASDHPRRCLLEPAGKGDCIPIGSSYDQIEKNFSRNFRGDLRKARNKLYATEAVEFCSSRDPSSLGTFLEEFLDVEASGWKGTQGTGTAIKLSADLTRFYRNLVDTLSPAGACEINLLRSGGRCIAGQFSLRVGDTYSVLKIGYDESQSRLAPGNMLMERLLQRLVAEEQVTLLDLVTDAKWHASWKPRSDRAFNAYVFRRSPRGLLLWAYKAFRSISSRAGPERHAPRVRSPAA